MSSQDVVVRTQEGDFAATLHSPRVATLPIFISRPFTKDVVEVRRVDLPWLALGTELIRSSGLYIQRYVAFADDPRDGEWRKRLVMTANNYSQSNYVCLGRSLLPDTSFWNTPFTKRRIEFVSPALERWARVSCVDGRYTSLPGPLPDSDPALERARWWQRIAS